ncbi:MAG: M81 family metallopeptidase [Gammaproteobacteria bacterium]|nr:M81 family metallopeptidase [Gammaproteobacteria bacterium]
MRYRVLTAEVAHETNTFSRIATDEQAFRNGHFLLTHKTLRLVPNAEQLFRNDLFLLDQDAIAARGSHNTELAGFLDIGRKYSWQLDHILSANAGPSGKVTTAAFDWLVDPVVAALESNRYDGILLGLHGAMVTDFCEDGEGELLQRLREVVGAKIPIAITLDLHANVTEKMCDLANIIVSYKTYPHIDMRDCARQAGEILQRSLTGEISPRTIRVHRPMLEEVNGGRTDVGPMIERVEAAKAWELRPDAYAVSINAGFASADIVEVGPTVLVTAEGDMDAHRAFAESLADDIWKRRHEVLNHYLDVDSAAAIARQFSSAEGPLVIADYADNPGGGGYGDSTNLLCALLDAGVNDACFGPMVDGATVKQLYQHEIGATIPVKLGGKTDPAFGGGPLDLTVELVSKSDGSYTGGGEMIGGLQHSFGPTVVVRAGGIEILITTIAQQMLDLQQFKSFGIIPEAKKIIALKSMQHFRADFEPIAGQVIVCDSGALCTPDYQRLEYRNVRRPIFPLDQNFEI